MQNSKHNPTRGFTKKEVLQYFINQSLEKFGDRFDFSLIDSIETKKSPAKIICKQHGILETSFYNHLGSSFGCPYCGEEACRKSKTFTLDEFNNKLDIKYPNRDWKVISEYTHNTKPVTVEDKNGFLHSMKPNVMLNSSSTPSIRTAINKEEYCLHRFNQVHNFKFKYPNFEYCGTKCKVNVVCKKGHNFTRTPNDHNNGVGCPHCADEALGDRLRSNTEEFSHKANMKHGVGTYDYTKSIYISAIKKIEIGCRVEGHGTFWQKPNGHLGGEGCPICGRENGGYGKKDYIKQAKGREGIMYIIRCWDEEEEFYKIGITVLSVKERFAKGSSLSYNYEIIYQYICDAGCVWDTEKKYHKDYKPFQYFPKVKFQGYTECFTKDLPIQEIIDKLNKL